MGTPWSTDRRRQNGEVKKRGGGKVRGNRKSALCNAAPLCVPAAIKVESREQVQNIRTMPLSAVKNGASHIWHNDE
jgi:hypothetical protein